MDGQITNERLYNGDWNPISDVAVGRFDGGWTLETAIPFKSLRYRRRGSNETYGVDGTFAFHDNLRINTYWARTRTSGVSGDDVSHRAQVDYAGDRYGVQVERLVVGDNFNPEVGFLQRDDFERSFGLFRFSPRPQSITAIRKLTWEGRLDYFTDRGGVLETRQAQGVFGILFENTDQFTATYARGPIHDQCGDDADDLHSHPA